jgi:hypothetical protein
MSTYYPPPVDRLLSLGREPAMRRLWPDYRHLGLDQRHVQSLIAMACDEELLAAPEKDRRAWAPIHAWRSLAELEAPAAAEPLLALMVRRHHDEWASDELPMVLGELGPAVLPGVTLLLFDETQPDGLRGLATLTLTYVAANVPERRDEVIAILARQLEDWAIQSIEMNTHLVLSLMDLQATEAAPLLEAAFVGNAVDLTAVTWTHVQVELGLLPESALDTPIAAPTREDAVPRRQPDAKARRKAQKQARQRNRKRK